MAQNTINQLNRTHEMVNPFQLARSHWLIDGVPVTATAAQLNSAGTGGGISALQVPLPLNGFVNQGDGYCFAPVLTGAIPFVYLWTSSTYPATATSAYSFIATGTEILGFQSFNLQIGIYQFYMSFVQNFDCGIYTITTTGPGGFSDVQTIDFYNLTQKYNMHLWQLTTSQVGVYTMTITSDSKNDFSSGYNLLIGEISGALVS
jgi:hypothetical protein